VRRLVGRFHWSLRPNQENSNYRIFDSVSEVPFPVWWNPALIVEEFAPEMREGFYCLRTWTFLGDRETNSLSYSRRPIVKLSNVERREVVDEIPDELRRMRSQMGFEFGKFDYGIVDGRVLLYDANRTPSLGAEVPASFVDRLRHLADGIHAYLPDIIDDVDESTPPPGHWSDVARLWQQVGAPLRPCETDLDFLRERIDGWAREHGAPRALILGVTPEFHRLPWPDGTDLLATDNNRNMIDAIWPGRAEQVIEHDWISLPFDSASRDIVLCDGGLHLVRPSDQKALVETLGRILAPGGLCFFRLFVPPAERESPEFVLEDLIAGRIPNLNILKLRLGMALQPTMIEGVGVAEVWNRVHSACPDFEALADRIGWSLEHLLALETYRESPNRYHFLTVAEVRTLFCSVPDSPARFSVEEVATPKYALGERCPTILLRRRD
jgi:SAM-dependent methyltransferase